MWEQSKLRVMHWDEPDAELIKKERSFIKAGFSYGDLQLPYRLFIPAIKAPVPLVLYLHGADDRYDDNVYHIIHHENACVFAADSWQMRNPCYVLAPHCPDKMFWEQDDLKRTLKGLLDDVIAKYSNIDKKRIYIFGNSMGGVGTLAMIKEYPHFFSRALSICGATDGKHLEAFSDVALTLVHAEDDRIVKPIRYFALTGQEFLGSFALYEALLQKGISNVYLKKYPEGSMMKDYGINPHCSWFPALRDETVKARFFGAE